MPPDLPQDLQRLRERALRSPEVAERWERLFVAAARLDFLQLDLPGEVVAPLYRLLREHPGSLALGPLLLASLGLRVPEKEATSPEAAGWDAALAREGHRYWYHPATGLPLAALREIDQMAMHLVPPEPGEPPRYLDATWIDAGRFRCFLKTEERGVPRPWRPRNVPDHFPAAFVSHLDARRYAEWAGGRLPDEETWARGQLPPGVAIPREIGSREEATDLRRCCAPTGSREFERKEETWVEDLSEHLAEVGGRASIHEWTSSTFPWPNIGSDAEYFEKLEARYGTGVLVLGACELRKPEQGPLNRIRRYAADQDEAYPRVGFRVALHLDGARDPTLSEDLERLREKARKDAEREAEWNAKMERWAEEKEMHRRVAARVEALREERREKLRKLATHPATLVTLGLTLVGLLLALS